MEKWDFSFSEPRSAKKVQYPAPMARGRANKASSDNTSGLVPRYLYTVADDIVT